MNSDSSGSLRSGTAKPLRIVIADDHEVVLQGLRSLLEAEPNWQICAQASNGRQAAEKVAELQPDIAVLDISMPELNGLEAARQIVRSVPRCRILVLTMHESDDILEEALAIGVHGYLVKSDAGRELVAAVAALSDGKRYFSSSVAGSVVDCFLERPPNRKSSASARLSAREREVLQLLAEGKSSKEVASALGVAVKTAETHRTNILRKLDLHSIADLVRFAIRNKIAQP